MSNQFNHRPSEEESEERSQDRGPRLGHRGFVANLKTYGPFRSNNGLIFGVARGLADHYGWSPGLMRIILILATGFLFFWPTIIAYLAAALLMSPAPTSRLDTPAERDIWLQTQMDPDGAMGQLARRAAVVEKRLRRLEDFITSREYAWTKKMGE